MLNNQILCLKQSHNDFIGAQLRVLTKCQARLVGHHRVFVAGRSACTFESHENACRLPLVSFP